MARHAILCTLVVLAVAFGQAAAIAQICSNTATPVSPQKTRIESQKYSADRKRVEVVIAFDNPTTANTGCPTSYTVSLVDDKNTQLGAKVSMSNPLTSPVKHTVFLVPSTKHTIQSVELATAAGKSSRVTVGLTFVTIAAPPSAPCKQGASPLAPSNTRVESQKYLADKGRVETVISFTNPTNPNSGCPVSYTVSLLDDKNTALGAQVSMSSPTTNPVRYVSYLKPGTRHTLAYAELKTSDGKSARQTVNTVFTTIQAPIVLPAALCSDTAAPVAARNVRVEKQRFDSNTKKTEVTIAWDNPTTSSTGCISTYVVDLVDSKNTALGVRSNLSPPNLSPVRNTFFLIPGQRYTIRFVETQSKNGIKVKAQTNLAFTVAGAPITPL